MNTVIFRTAAPILTALMFVFSVFVLLRGHNEPGGGFIGGLIGASGVAIYGIAAGVKEVRRALKVDPLAIAGVGVLISAVSGILSVFWELPFLTALWAYIPLGGDAELALSTPTTFDIGVYLVVLGTISAIALGLEDEEEES